MTVRLGADAQLDTDGGPQSGVLCALHTGPVLPGQDAGGPVMRCDPGLRCIALEGNWACCTIGGTGGVSNCLPFAPNGNTSL